MKLLLETLLATGQNVVNYALSLDPHTQNALTELQDRCIAIHILSLDKTIYLHVDTQQLFFNLRAPKNVDVSISASSKSLFQLSKRTPTPDQHVQMQGNMHVAQKISHILQDFHPDWEEALAHTVGDVTGHALAQTLRHTHEYLKQTAAYVLRQGADYVVDEDPMIAAKSSIDNFIEEVDKVRTKCDRLLVRARLCEQRV
ncbi:MAG: SCP2 sterol-binding domain-containing protein [Legionellales bacterium]|jgi:ubiquinone biosynthesis protein UbiJ